MKSKERLSRKENAGLLLIGILMTGAVCIGYNLQPVSHEEADKTAEVVLHEMEHPTVKPVMQTVLMGQLQADRLLPAVEQVESHGNANAVSSKGARGLYQVMPDTAKHPGFGVMPMRNHTIKEQRRFARDYLNALLRKYHGNHKLALAAYNAGVGAVDRVIAKLPKETRQYVDKVELAMEEE